MISSSVQAAGLADPTESWKEQWEQMLEYIKGMSAEEALMYVMYQMLPEIGDYLQGALESNADTQNDLSRIIGDMEVISRINLIRGYR